MSWLTLLPALIAIVVVFWRKEVIIALGAALFTAVLLLQLQQAQLGPLLPLDTLVASIEVIVTTVADEGNARLLLFALLVGALMAYMRDSGGVSALVQRLIHAGVAKNARQSRFLAFFTGIIIFIESNLSVLTAGFLTRGLFDKFKLSRAELAYIVDSTSAPICILILLNGWGAFILGLLGHYQLGISSVDVMLGSIALNFYPILTLLLVLFTVITGKHFGPMRYARVYTHNDTPSHGTNVHHAIAVHHDSDVAQVHTTTATPSAAQPTPAQDQLQGKVRYMLLPLFTMIISMIGVMLWTGNGDLTAGSGSKAVLYATAAACLMSYVLLTIDKRFSHQQLVDIGFKGMSELLGLVSILLLAIALGSALKSLGTGAFIAQLVSDSLPLWLIPAMLFLAGALISFTTGTSWGTFAILIPIGMPLVAALELPPALLLAAILGGGVFGDHCSPISDTTAVSAVAAGCDLLEHVQTQLPYALCCAALSLIGYLVVGWVWLA
jgi:Na+/H+ antiporter NhaC